MTKILATLAALTAAFTLSAADHVVGDFMTGYGLTMTNSITVTYGTAGPLYTNQAGTQVVALTPTYSTSTNGTTVTTNSITYASGPFVDVPLWNFPATGSTNLNAAIMVDFVGTSALDSTNSLTFTFVPVYTFRMGTNTITRVGTSAQNHFIFKALVNGVTPVNLYTNIPNLPLAGLSKLRLQTVTAGAGASTIIYLNAVKLHGFAP